MLKFSSFLIGILFLAHCSKKASTAVTFEPPNVEKIAKTEVSKENALALYSSKYKNLDHVSVLAFSAKESKPILYYFTGYGCINAIKMEDLVLSKNQIPKRLNEDFIFVPLFVDDKEILADSIRVGKRNLELQVELFQANHQPFMAILDHEGNFLRQLAYTLDREEVLKFLDGSQ